MFKKIINILPFILLLACSQLQKAQTELSFESTPQSAEVFTSDGTLLGKTPFSLKNSELNKFAKSGYVLVKTKKVGFVDETFLIPIESFGNFTFKLTKVSQVHFKTWVMPSYAQELNQISKSLLEVQAKMFLKDFVNARKDLETLNHDFPHIAAGHTMLATLAIQENKRDEAKGHLMRALELDKDDKTALRLLNLIEGKKE
jgi:hypothetical protein